jgi:hypothetical protein
MSESLDPQLNDLAAALASLRPAAPALNRDRLLFNAGRASAPRSWFWRVSAAISTTATAFLALVLLLRPAPTPVVTIVYVSVAAPAADPLPKPEAPPTPTPPESEPAVPPYYSWPTTPYSRLEDRVLRWGLDGLAEPTPPAAPPPETLDSLLRSL